MSGLDDCCTLDMLHEGTLALHALNELALLEQKALHSRHISE